MSVRYILIYVTVCFIYILFVVVRLSVRYYSTFICYDVIALRKNFNGCIGGTIIHYPLSTQLKIAVSQKQEVNVTLDTYERAISTLNSSQSNASTIAQSVALRDNKPPNHVQETEIYLKRTGVDYNDLDSLSVIHVAGTKGKGSTCAFTESILNSCGLKTGFFSSPHLIHATERIRINGQPISKSLFAKYFRKVYRSLDKNKEHDHDMPMYFKFLTVMSFHVFLAEKVDVLILEVGIGGEGCTNVVRNTKTVGITSLGLEHTALLGNTLAEIAWQEGWHN